jgi:hypothetical protein
MYCRQQGYLSPHLIVLIRYHRTLPQWYDPRTVRKAAQRGTQRGLVRL